MADQPSQPTDVADEANEASADTIATSETLDQTRFALGDQPSTDGVTEAAEPIRASGDAGDGGLLSELARAMHATATAQYERLNADLERLRVEQVEAIADRTNVEVENLKADAETDIGSIEIWAKVESEKIKLERLRRIDARREQLAAQLDRQDTIKDREVFAIQVAIDAHRNEVDLFFGRMERETDPSAIARVAATMPPFPSLGDVAEQARHNAAAEFATLESQVDPSTRSTDRSTTETPAAAELDLEDAVSESRLMAVMDPDAARVETEPTQPWDAPYAVSVTAGTSLDEEEAPVGVGSTLLRTVRSIRPMAGRQDRGPDEGDAPR